MKKTMKQIITQIKQDIPKKISALIISGILAVVTFIGIFVYNSYWSPEKILAKGSEQFSKLETVHGEMDISMNLYENGTSSPQKIILTSSADLNQPKLIQKQHMRLTSSQGNVEINMILLEKGDMYLNMPGITNQTWINMNLQTLKEQGNMPIDPQSTDYFNQSLAFLKSVKKGSIIKLEDQVIDGMKTTHLRVDISTPQYIEHMKQLSYSDSQIKQLENVGIKSDVWIDQQTGNIAKIYSKMTNVKVEDKDSTPLGYEDIEMTMIFSKYNQPVTIEKPRGKIITYDEYVDIMRQELMRSYRSQQENTFPSAYDY